MGRHQGVRLPDHQRAWDYALESLATGLTPDLYYHSVAHTRDDVVPAAIRLAEMEGVSGEDLNLLITAAWYHDTGFLLRNEDNEVIAVDFARRILPDFGYNASQIDAIAGIIMATRLPQTPHNLLEEIMADADLDALGREDFFIKSDLLRDEMAVLGQPTSEEEWCQIQLSFLQEHRYFTASANRLRLAGKERNMQALKSHIPGCAHGD
jgi:uncharacterized protein